jgi:glycosyltransferase involved in cell wall biosynthesis
MEEVSIVITSCGRPDLLEKTIESFLLHNTYPIKKWIITEDSGTKNINKHLEDKYPTFLWLSGDHLGQIKSIDKAYSHVETEYIFHLEDDWETYKDGAIIESVKILKENSTVSTVMCREHTERVYYMSDNPPILKCWGGWGFYSFNPGLRRLSDYKNFFNSSFSTFLGGELNGLSCERKLNEFFREKGFAMALTPDPAGYIHHIGEGRHINSVYKIGLCMIVKNESHIITESLTATLPLIDTYCIVDTGSTDNTIEIIKKFYELHNIQGQIHEKEWKNFGHNRSEALKLCDGKMDYILVIDADDLISWTGDGKQDLLKVLQASPNVVNFTIRQGDLSYTRMQMFKANDDWKYNGVLHEYPSNGKQNQVVKCPTSMFMTSRRLGDRSKCDDKMKRDIAILLKGIEEEPDNERYMFYLAQSYRDDGQTDKAIEWYTKRYEAGKWFEEKYISAYNITKLSRSKEWAWKAHECNPKRIECLVSYLSYCRSTNQFSREILAMALYASTIPKPTDQHLFLENDVYDWRIWDELSIIAFYCGNTQLAQRVSEKLLSENKFPPQHTERIKNNYKYSLTVNKTPDIPEKISVYWWGQYSSCKAGGSIETFVKNIKIKKPLSFLFFQNDGIMSDENFKDVMSTTTETRKIIIPESQCKNIESSATDGSIPIICALSTRGTKKSNILLLPLDDNIFQHGIDSMFKNVNIIPWKDRKTQVFWRGTVSGFDRPSLREKIVKLLFNNINSDVKFAFIGNNKEKETIDKKYIVEKRSELQEFLYYKYLLIIDGHVIASNHQWTFGSGAVPIMITHPDNNYWFKSFLIPMKHYVPIKYDLSDLEEKIEWLVNNDAKAHKIAKNAMAFSKEFFTPESQSSYIEREIKSIIKKYKN